MRPAGSEVDLPERGEIWWADLDAGRRPVVVLSRNEAIRGRRRMMVAACSTVRRGLPSEVELDPQTDPVPLPCVAQLDAVVDVPARVLTERLGRLGPTRIGAVCRALAVATGCC